MDLPTNYNDLHYTEKRKVREEYVRRQNNKCYYCGALLTGPPKKEIKRKAVNKLLFPKGFFNWPIHLHHDHVTGMTKGAVHCYCNAVMWQYDGE